MYKLPLLLFFLNVADIITTHVGLNIGLAELNPVFNSFPFTLNILIKITLTLFLIIVLNLTLKLAKEKYVKTFIHVLLLALNTLYIAVVVNNVVLIAHTI
ncbi:MAG: DUF5658 family protein [Candidatus Bathyarchaeota archaeon]